MLTKEQNPNGLYQKYTISRTDGLPIPINNEYFILKLKGEGDSNHIEASKKAALTYADAIESTLPKLAEDLRQKVNFN